MEIFIETQGVDDILSRNCSDWNRDGPRQRISLLKTFEENPHTASVLSQLLRYEVATSKRQSQDFN